VPCSRCRGGPVQRERRVPSLRGGTGRAADPGEVPKGCGDVVFGLRILPEALTWGHPGPDRHEGSHGATRRRARPGIPGTVVIVDSGGQRSRSRPAPPPGVRSATLQVDVRRTFSARGPFGPSPTSNSTLSPSRSLSSPSPYTALWWKKYSFPASSLMNPNPLSTRNVRIVPVNLAS
jgi:hypothetical protein